MNYLHGDFGNEFADTIHKILEGGHPCDYVQIDDKDWFLREISMNPGWLNRHGLRMQRCRKYIRIRKQP